MTSGSGFVGWAVDTDQRGGLLARFPPRYARTVADHVTFKFGDQRAALPTETTGQVVGLADDDAGVQALVVAIDGSTARPDGGVFHITWSLEPGREARESNDVIRERGWTPLSIPVAVALHPRIYPPPEAGC